MNAISGSLAPDTNRPNSCVPVLPRGHSRGREDQRDDQSLPPYEELDPVLEAYVEDDRTAHELVAAGVAPDLVDQVVRLVDGA